MTDNLTQLRFADAQLSTGVRLHYAEQGDPSAHPIILLHGYTDSWLSFSGVLPRLAATYRVYALDQRGHGDSDRPEDGAYTFDDYAADVVAFMDAMGLERASLVGHSMGSMVAQRVALNAPQRVARLILIASATTVRNDGVLELQRAVEMLDDPVPVEFAREFQASTVYHPVPDDFMDGAVAASLKVPARVWRGAMEGMLASHPITLDRILTPTLILWGDHDTIFSRAEQDALVATLADASLKVYAETGHALHWERPEQFVRDVEAFVVAGPTGEV
ncbi:MAG: alpha/beta hydrolase [Pyrinomonadaceae bacterium]